MLESDKLHSTILTLTVLSATIVVFHPLIFYYPIKITVIENEIGVLTAKFANVLSKIKQI